jgi:hypothetical protein
MAQAMLEEERRYTPWEVIAYTFKWKDENDGNDSGYDQ